MSCAVVIGEARCLLREAVRALLEAKPGIQVVGEASNGRELVDLCLTQEPDVAIVDARLPPVSGLEAIRMVRSRSRRPFFVVTSSRDSRDLARLALLAGASAFLTMGASAGELLAAVEASHRGRTFLPEVLRSPLDGSGRSSDSHGEALTARQTEVLRLVAEGRSSREIATALGVSIKTAQTHRLRLMRKIRAHKASELVRYAIREGLVEA